MNCPHCNKSITDAPKTKRQREILDFYIRFVAKNGHSPSYTTIARHIGVNSKATVAKHIGTLKAQGYLQPVLE